ncbi:MAG TPA: SMP-30/gluconolactonase/LRE family protein [Chloroflexota bacterium]
MNVEVVAPEFERIVPAGTVVQKIDADCIFGEGPVWNAREHYFLWTDIVGDRMYTWTQDEGVRLFRSPTGHANGTTYDRAGRLVVAGWGARTIWRLEPDGRAVILASHYEGQKINTPNDIVVKSDGAIYWTDTVSALFICGMPGEDVQRYLDYCAVFRLSPDGATITPVVTDFANPNGLAFSPDESLLYINDTTRRHIRVFDVQPDGSLANGRLFYQDEGSEPGNPDGMKVDQEGNVYCTGSGGIHVVAPSGKLLGVIKLHPITNMAWGDADWRTLYVTGRAEFYRIRLGIPGVPV